MGKNQETGKEKCAEEKIVPQGPIFGHRHIQAILLFFCVAIEFMTRSTLSLSIIAMTDNSTSSNPDIPTYDWDDTSVILSSFYWGYVVLQVLAGQMSKNYGAKWMLVGAMFINSLALGMVPLAAQVAGSKGVMVCRILQGLAQGGIFPSTHTMLGRWAPESERSRMTTFVYSGVSVGTIVCLPLTGLISKSKWGWPASCYLFGGVGIVWCLVWILCGYSNPVDDPFISSAEKYYIATSLNQKEEEEVLPTPWKEILTCLPFWSCLVATTGAGFGVIFLQNEIPTYLGKVMDFDVASSGMLTSMTGAVGVFFSYLYGFLSDFLVTRNYLSATNTRKMFDVVSMYGSAATMLIMGYLSKSHAELSIFMLTLSSVFISGILYGHGINPIDLSPRFSGIILAFSNSVSCIAALFAPLTVQFVVKDQTDASQWRIVFIIAAVMYMGTATFFGIFASAERQWWDAGGNKENKDKVDAKTSSVKEFKNQRKISTISDIVGISM